MPQTEPKIFTLNFVCESSSRNSNRKYSGLTLGHPIDAEATRFLQSVSNKYLGYAGLTLSVELTLHFKLTKINIIHGQWQEILFIMLYTLFFIILACLGCLYGTVCPCIWYQSRHIGSSLRAPCWVLSIRPNVTNISLAWEVVRPHCADSLIVWAPPLGNDINIMSSQLGRWSSLKSKRLTLFIL